MRAGDRPVALWEPYTRGEMRDRMLRHVGEGVVVRPPFFCEYGAVSIGDGTFVNVDAVMLDVAPITISAAWQFARSARTPSSAQARW